MTYVDAALTVLAYAERPLSVAEITAVAVADGLVHPRGKTPERTMSSVLYRRMAADPDAPMVSRGGLFWLRGRSLQDEAAHFASLRARRGHGGSGPRTRSSSLPPATRRVTPLPTPPLRLPFMEPLGATEVTTSTRRVGAAYAPVRRERALARAGDRAAALLTRIDARLDRLGVAATLAETAQGAVQPLLRHLGYRLGVDSTLLHGVGRRTLGLLLSGGGGQAIAVHVHHAAHDLGLDDAWRAVSSAQVEGAAYAATTNGRELRLYARSIVEARDDVAEALVLTLDLAPTSQDDAARAPQAAALWLLAKPQLCSGALDAYVLDRVVGSALLSALDDVYSPIARALTRAVQESTGIDAAASIVARHARLAVRSVRGRDGEALADDIAAAAAIRQTSGVVSTLAEAAS